MTHNRRKLHISKVVIQAQGLEVLRQNIGRVGIGLNLSGPSPTSTVLEVRLFRGPAPDRGEAYDAREVRANLSGRE
jgi:hypothetical protein